MPVTGRLPDESVEIIKAVLEKIRFAPYQLWRTRLPADWLSHDRFVYVGPAKDGKASWPHAQLFVVEWVLDKIVPRALKLNRSRIQRAIPVPPQFDARAAMDAMFVLEGSSRQGTGFLLDGAGFVTCHHVLEKDTKAYLQSRPEQRFDIEPTLSDEQADLAVFRSEIQPRGKLEIGESDGLGLMDHILVAGFPNHYRGDTGTVVPGVITGRRPKRGISVILTNAPIVFEGSGGPVIDKSNKVIGVAASGSRSINEAVQSEDNGIIPIEVLKNLVQKSR